MFVTVEFDTQDQMNGFVKSPDAYINYIDDDGAKPIPWPRTPFLFSATAAPWDVSAPFTTVPPDNWRSHKKKTTPLRGTGNGTIIYTDAVTATLTHTVAGTMHFVEFLALNAESLDESETSDKPE